MNFRFMTIEDENKLLRKAEEIVKKTKSGSNENICLRDNKDNELDQGETAKLQTHTIPPHSIPQPIISPPNKANELESNYHQGTQLEPPIESHEDNTRKQDELVKPNSLHSEPASDVEAILDEEVGSNEQLNEIGKTVVEIDRTDSTFNMPLDGQNRTGCQNFDDNCQHQEARHVVLPTNGSESNFNTQQNEQHPNLNDALCQSTASSLNGSESNLNTQQIEQNQDLPLSQSINPPLIMKINTIPNHFGIEGAERETKNYCNRQHDGSLVMDIEYYSHENSVEI